MLMPLFYSNTVGIVTTQNQQLKLLSQTRDGIRGEAEGTGVVEQTLEIEQDGGAELLRDLVFDG